MQGNFSLLIPLFCLLVCTNFYSCCNNSWYQSRWFEIQDSIVVRCLICCRKMVGRGAEWPKLGGGSDTHIVERVIRESDGAAHYPTLTRTNYGDWTILMKVQLQAQGLWDVIEEGPGEILDDRRAMSALLRAVPPELVRTLGVKATAKEAWDTLKTMRVGVERVREAKAQTCWTEFEALAFKDGEGVESFGIRLTAIMNDLQVLGDPLTEHKAVQKFLRSVPRKYKQMAMAIESLVDLKTLSIEELTGRLRVVEERGDLDDSTHAGGRLLLTEEEWKARQRGKDLPGGIDKKNKSMTKQKSPTGSKGKSSSSGGNERKKGNCHYCGIPGHWKRECRKAKRDREQQEHVNLTQVEAEGIDDPALLMVQIEALDVVAQQVYLNEEKVVPVDAGDGAWYLDTGASSHMTGDKKAFKTLDETVHGTVRFGDGSVVNIRGRGAVMFKCLTGDHRILSDVYYIPSLRSNIISLGQLDENGCRIIIEGGVLCILDRARKVLAQVTRTQNRLYMLHLNLATPVSLLIKKDDEAWLWHARFGHLHFRALQTLSKNQMVTGIPVIEHVEELCDGCCIGKQHRNPFPRVSNYRAREPLELVHCDLCGPITPSTAGGKRYFLLVVDDYSRFMWVELLATKDEALRCFKKIKAVAEAGRECKLRAFRSDRGGEFNSCEFAEFCNQNGIKHNTTAGYSPQQNGVVERRNQMVVEMARCLMKTMAVPGIFWGEAVKTAVYILNRVPTRSLVGVTPYEAWHNRKPNVHHLRTFGCVAHVKRLGPNVDKLADRSILGVFTGYEEGAKAYRVYDPIKDRMHITRDVLFEESRAWYMENSDSKNHTEPRTTFTVVYTTEESTVPPPEPTMTEGEPKTPEPATMDTQSATPTTQRDDVDTDSAPRRYRLISDIYNASEEVIAAEDGELCLVTVEEPTNVEQAMSNTSWRNAMEEEMRSIIENKTWEPVSLPANQKAIGLKWVFKVKRDPAGNIVKYKARLVAKGYAQRQGVDYEEVFAPVARMETVRLLLALAAHGKWEVHHMDVKSAFLNGDLAEDVYVEQPPGFIDGANAGKVLKLRKALYGLRQAPRAWNAKLDVSLSSLGFKKCPSEHAVYRRGNKSSFLLVGVYVDDLIITGTSVKDIVEFKVQMKATFKMSDLGLLCYYLGIEVHQRNGEITMNQGAYAARILECAGMSGCNSCHTPMESRLRLSKQDESAAVDATLYRSVMGSLRYLVHTRPDLAYAVAFASRFMEAPTIQHWAVVKQILRYIQGTLNYGCCYKSTGSKVQLVGYSDSDFAGDCDDRKSTSGIAFFIGNNIVTWTSQKQKVVALSSCEAEYVAASSAACQGVWLSRLIGELTGIGDQQFKLLVDNKSAIALCKNPVYHGRSKHIDTRFHYIRDCIETGKMDVDYVGTNGQLADILTKALVRNKFIEMRQELGMVRINMKERA
ncbi:unnamed protein product [Cuscuta epithymum]|uniref:Polyprotein n=1 Tax=Cuscuta epithymum TaxID=186058 RepID=A0AAV0GEG1_9ASTE|nr:unnamed protein product [Cuscuta epithymum]